MPTAPIRPTAEPAAGGEGLRALAVFAIAFVLFMPGQFVVPWDSTIYLSYARHLLDGEGLTNLLGVPVTERAAYVALVAGAVWLGGDSLLPLALLDTASVALLVSFTYLLGQRLFGRSAAQVAVILFVASSAWLDFLPRHLDPLWPAALLAAAWLLLAPGGGLAAAVGSGLAAGFAISVKAPAGLFVAVPVALLPLRALPGGWRRLAAFLLALAASLGVFYLLVLHGVHGAAAGGTPGAFARASFGEEGVWGLLGIAASGLARYVSEPATLFMPLLPVFVLALPWHAWRGIRGDAAHLQLLALVACTLPISALVGSLDLRPSQNLFLVAVVYISLGAAATHLWRRFGTGRPLRVAVAALLALVVVQAVFLPTSYKGALRHKLIVRALKPGVPTFEAIMPAETVAAWIREQVPAGQTVFIANGEVLHGAAFRMGQRNPVRPFPVVNEAPLATKAYLPRDVGALSSVQAVGTWTNPEYRHQPILVVDGAYAAAQLGAGGARVVLGDEGIDPLLRHWVERSGAFRGLGEVPGTEGRYRAWEWSGPAGGLAAGELLVSRGLVRHLELARRDDPGYYGQLVARLAIVTGRPRAAFDAIADGQAVDGVIMVE